METPSLIFAADHVDSVINELRAREACDFEDPKFGRLVLHHGNAGMPSYWEGRYIWKSDCTLVTLRIAVPPGARRPNAAQRDFVDDLEGRYPYYRAGALTLLKPAFRRYVGDQLRLKSMLEEFLLTGVTVPSFTNSYVVHEFLYRCSTDPRKAFYVTFENRWATKIRVDETYSLARRC
jgi:hypothetical protein